MDFTDIAGLLGGVGGVAWLVQFLVKRGITKADQAESDQEKAQDKKIERNEQRLDAIDVRLQQLDRSEGKWVTREVLDNLLREARKERDRLMSDEREVRQRMDENQNLRLDKIERKVWAPRGDHE